MIYDEDWVLYSINTVPPVGSSRATVWISLAHTCITVGLRPQLTFLFIVSHECRAYEIVKWKLNKLILCDMSAFEQEYSQVCL